MADIAAMYGRGFSIPQIAEATGMPRSTIRSRLVSSGIALRSRGDGVRLASDRIGGALRGKTRVFTTEWKRNISGARQKWADENAVGTRITSHGYEEHTRGEHKGRCVHVVLMETRIGRRLRQDEVVHHVDGDRRNNNIDNLALLTRSAHARLHQHENKIARKERKRANGRYC